MGRLRDPNWPVRSLYPDFWSGFLNGWIKGCVVGSIGLAIFLVAVNR